VSHDLLSAIASRGHVIEPAGVIEPAITEIGQLFRTTVPEDLGALWRQAREVRFMRDGKKDGSLIGAEEALRLLRMPGFGEALVDFGGLPFLYDDESNYFLLAMRPPIAGRIIYFPHDDSAEFKYRNLHSWLAEFLGAYESYDWMSYYMRATVGDYAVSELRTDDDRQAARALMVEGSRHLLAMQLIDVRDLDLWHELLESERFTRGEARRRACKLAETAQSELADLVARDQAEFKTFTMDCAVAARAAGLVVGDLNDSCLSIAGMWLDLDAFFARRKQERALPRFVEWCRDLAANRVPTDRADHYFAD